MASAGFVITQMEGMVGNMASTTVALQSVNTWVEACKAVMRSPGLRDKTDWSFLCSADVDESANDVEDGAVLYGLLVGQNSADASIDIICVTNDADGTLTVAAADAVSVPTLLYQVPAAGTDDTEEYWPVVYPKGVAFANHMMFGADGADGTNPAANDIRIWALYRTSTV